jgi:hypothetical protein
MFIESKPQRLTQLRRSEMSLLGSSNCERAHFAPTELLI